MRSHIVNVIDLEFDFETIIEIGLTTVDVRKRQILNTYSMPISDAYPDSTYYYTYEVSEPVSALTGWTKALLRKRGVPFITACERLRDKYGGQGRLLVVDTDTERSMLLKNYDKWWTRSLCVTTPNKSYPVGEDVLNVTSLFKIMNRCVGVGNMGLEAMLGHFDLKFEGKRHRASSDSYNIARLFLKLTEEPEQLVGIGSWSP